MRRAALVAIASALIFAACGSATASPTPTPTAAPTATPTALPTVAPTPPPTPVATPTAIPTPTDTPAPTPFPTGVPGALAFVKAYEDALVAGDYVSAWSMLGPGSGAWGNFANFRAERAIYLKTAGKLYTAVANPKGTISLTDWLSGQPFAATIDKTHAVLVKVTWTALKNNNAGWEMWVVNPAPGGWLLFEVR